MKTEATERKPFVEAMAFYHQDGLPAAWQQAMKFAGEGGRLATMPDIVAARLAAKPGETPWETYFTTLTAEYYGIGKSGKILLIIAHGIGPMSTLDGIRKAYSWEYKDKTRKRRGGRITQKEFWDLEAGKFGSVEIIDYEKYCRRYKYPFIQILQPSDALADPVLKARLGPQAEQCILAHTEHARVWHRQKAGLDLDQQGKYTLADVIKGVRGGKTFQDCVIQHAADGAQDSDPYIIKLGDAANCSYWGADCRIPEKGYALAHLISTGGLCHMCHERNESLTLDVSCHEWGNGVRIVGIKAGGSIKSGLHHGPDVYELLRKHWRELLVPMFPPDIALVGFRALMPIGDQWFTQYLKKGKGMDTWEPEYVVTSIEKIGEPVLFRTTVGGYHGFFKFGVNEIQAIAPPKANACLFVSEPENEWHDGNPTHQTAMAQFYQITVDASKRMMRANQLAHDFEKMMSLLA